MTRFRILILALILVTPAIPGMAQPDPAPPLRLEFTYPETYFPELVPLLDAAATSSTRIRMQAYRIDERESDVQAMEARQGFDVNLNWRILGAYELREDTDTNRLRYDGSLNLTVTKPLYDWGVLKSYEEMSRMRVRIEELQQDQTVREHLNEVRSTYLAWLVAAESIEILDQTIELAERFVENQEKLLEIGRSSEQEILEMQVRVQEHQERLALAQREVIYYRNRLLELTSAPDIVASLQGRDFDAFEPMDLRTFYDLSDRLRTEWQMDNPALAIRDTLSAIEEENYNAIAKRTRPRVDFLSGVYTDILESANTVDTTFRVNFFAGIVINWPIFDSHETAALKMGSLARQRMNDLAARELDMRLQTQLDRLLAQIEFNIKQIGTRDTRARILERRSSLVEQREQRALVTPIDRLEVQLDYQEVRRDALSARVEYLKNLMDLAALYESDPFAKSPEE